MGLLALPVSQYMFSREADNSLFYHLDYTLLQNVIHQYMHLAVYSLLTHSLTVNTIVQMVDQDVVIICIAVYGHECSEYDSIHFVHCSYNYSKQPTNVHKVIKILHHTRQFLYVLMPWHHLQ